MIKVGDKYLRNLEEQVQYLTDYHDVNQGLVQWGIRVVGQVAREADLPLPYNGEYGDTYAVGTNPPFSFYIWTRANASYSEDYWFPFGEISIVGPQGPEGPVGPQGPKGERGSLWFSGAHLTPPAGDTFRVGDLWLDKFTGDVRVRKENGGWGSVLNIMGPQGIQGPVGPQGPQGIQGPQGPKGATGDVGGFINIKGILSNANQLPLPSDIGNLSVGYLVGTQTPYDLYIQVGETPETAVWTNTGAFNAATLVTVNGASQNVWNADTKLDKVTTDSPYNRLYGVSYHGEQYLQNLDPNPVAWGLAQRNENGDILVPAEPGAPGAAVSRNYLESLLEEKADKLTAGTGESYDYVVCLFDGRGKQSGRELATTLVGMDKAYTIPVYWNNTVLDANQIPKAVIPVGIPKYDGHAANKKYVDDTFKSLKSYKHRVQITGRNSSLASVELTYNFINNSPVQLKANRNDTATMIPIFQKLEDMPAFVKVFDPDLSGSERTKLVYGIPGLTDPYPTDNDSIHISYPITNDYQQDNAELSIDLQDKGYEWTISDSVVEL